MSSDAAVPRPPTKDWDGRECAARPFSRNSIGVRLHPWRRVPRTCKRSPGAREGYAERSSSSSRECFANLFGSASSEEAPSAQDFRSRARCSLFSGVFRSSADSRFPIFSHSRSRWFRCSRCGALTGSAECLLFVLCLDLGDFRPFAIVLAVRHTLPDVFARKRSIGNGCRRQEYFRGPRCFEFLAEAPVRRGKV